MSAWAISKIGKHFAEAARRVGDHDPESDAPTTDQIYVGLSWTGDIIAAASDELTQANLAVLAAVKNLSAAFANQSMSGVKQAAEALSDASKAVQVAAKNIDMNASVLARKAAEHLNRSARV